MENPIEIILACIILFEMCSRFKLTATVINAFAPYQVRSINTISYAWSMKQALEIMKKKEFDGCARVYDQYFGNLVAQRIKKVIA